MKSPRLLLYLNRPASLSFGCLELVEASKCERLAKGWPFRLHEPSGDFLGAVERDGNDKCSTQQQRARHSGLLTLNRTFRLRPLVSCATCRKCASIRIRLCLRSSVRSLRSSLSSFDPSCPSLSPGRSKPDSSPQAGHFERAISPIFCPSIVSMAISDIGAPHLQ